LIWCAASGNRENKDGVKISACEDCVVHFDDKGGDTGKILAVTLNTLLERRENGLIYQKLMESLPK